MEILKKIRKENGYSQQDLASYLGITKQAYSNYETGNRNPDVWTLKKIANFYHMPLDSLVKEDSEKMASAGSIRIPVLGSVPAGIAIDAIEDIVDWEEIPLKLIRGGKQYFGLVVKGDSMYPKYMDKDIVIVLRQSTFESQDDCVVYVNGYNATLKTVIQNKDGSITLRPINPEYPPRTYDAEELKTGILSIAGVVVELRRKIK